MGFTARVLANKCLELLELQEFSEEVESDFPEAHWFTCNESNRKHVAFFVEPSFLELSIEEFSEKYLLKPIKKLRQKCGTNFIISNSTEFELPKGLDFAAISDDAKVRVVLAESEVPYSPTSKRNWPLGENKRYYDIARDEWFRGNVSPIIRIDIRVEE